MYETHCSDIDDLINFLIKYKKELDNKKLKIIKNDNYDKIFLSINNDIYNLKDKLLYLISENYQNIENSEINKEVSEYIEVNKKLKLIYPFIITLLTNF